MAKNESEQYHHILDAAFEEFAHKGFRGATIKSISQAARLESPLLIYWNSPSNEEHLETAIDIFLRGVMIDH